MIVEIKPPVLAQMLVIRVRHLKYFFRALPLINNTHRTDWIAPFKFENEQTLTSALLP